MFKPKYRQLVAAITLALATTPLIAKDLKVGDKDYGKIDFFAKAQHVVDGRDNGYDPNEGTAYLVKLGYLTPSWNGFSAGIAGYVSGDLFGISDMYITDSNDRLARGLFVSDDGDEKALIGEAYLKYQSDMFSLHGGRQMYKTPLTTIAYSLMPNFYTVFGGDVQATSELSVGLAQITEMSFGSRSMTDWSLIGENTGTAGAAIKTSTIGQAEFHNISTATFGSNAPDTDGITVFNAVYDNKPKKLKIQLWDYYVDDIANNIYVQADGVIPVNDKMKVKLSGQYLHQSDTGSAYTKNDGDLDFDLFGVKATLAGKGWAVYGALNHSTGDTAMLNAWGGDPAYTSSIFSRNAYRENVTAYKVGFKYQILKNLTFMASHADYGQSDTSSPTVPLIGGGTADPQTDAHETDFVLVYKPVKDVMLKLFHARRTSEYDGQNNRDLTQAHTRFIASFSY